MKVKVILDFYGDLFRATAWLGARQFLALSRKDHEEAKQFLLRKLRAALKSDNGVVPGEKREEVLYL